MSRRLSIVHILLLIVMLSGFSGRRLEAAQPAPQTPAAPAEAPQLRQALESQGEGLPPGSVVRQIDQPSELSSPLPQADLGLDEQAGQAWTSHHGTRGGQIFMQPRQPSFEVTPQGPEVAIGNWRQTMPLNNSSSASAIAETSDGRVYAAISGTGLYVYSSNASGIYGWVNIPAGVAGPASNNITDLEIFDGALWVGTAANGLSVLNLTTNAWAHYNTANTANLAGNSINRLTPVDAPTGLDYIWISTSTGATRYTQGRPTPVWARYTVANTAGGLPSNYIYDIVARFVGATTWTWFSTDSGLAYWNGASTTATWTDWSGVGGCLWGRATQMISDKNNGVWFGIENYYPGDVQESPDGTASPQAGSWQFEGVCYYNGSTGTLYNQVSPGLPLGSAVSDFSIDGAGRVWMSFSGTGGAASYDKGKWAIYQTGATTTLVNNNISAVEAIGEAVWFGHNGSSTMAIYTPSWETYTTAEIAPALAGVPNSVLVEDTITWVGIGTGFAWRNAGGWQNRSIPGNASPVSTLARGSDGLLWIGTQSNGIHTFNGVNTFEQLNTADGLPSNSIRDLQVDQDGRMWAATSAGLAMRGDSYWLRFNMGNSPITSDDLRALSMDASGRIWIGTAANGINIFNPKVGGGWSSQTTANGLPSNVINALLTDPTGAIWAATAAGVARWDPVGNSWTIYNVAGGQLASNEALSLASDGAGTIWVGTIKGAAQFQAGIWTHHHVPGAGILTDAVRAIGADAKRLWAVDGSGLAVRGPPNIPLGSNVPTITSFTPTSGGPFTQVTITGNYFDNRGPEFNKVYLKDTFTVVEIVSVSTTQLVVKIPLLGKTGQFRVQANGLSSAWSASTFTVKPVITKVSASCLGVGSVLEIEGYGFTGDNNVLWVQVGSGPWQIADYWDATLAKRVILPGDTNGTVKLKIGAGGPVVTGPSITIATLSIPKVKIQQGVEGTIMVWGKRTLVQVQPKATGCASRITGGTLYWKKKNGTEVRGGTAYFTSPDGLGVPTSSPANIKLENSVNFIAEFYSNRSAWSDLFAMSQFNGVRIVLKNGWQEVVEITLPKSAFSFVDSSGKREIISMQVAPPTYTQSQDKRFWKNALEGMADVARAYPMQDVKWLSWLNYTPIWYSFDYVYLDDDKEATPENYAEVRDAVADYLDPSGKRQAMALIADELYVDGPGGKATLGGSAAVSFNFEGDLAAVFLQEAIHNLGSVDTDAANHDSLNEYHSRYDEGEWNKWADYDANCMSSLNFRRAIEDQVGPGKRVYRLDSGDPYEFVMTGCGMPDKMPKSAMAYVDATNNDNTFLEPLDYTYTLSEICGGSCTWSFLQPDVASPDLAQTSAITPAKALRLSGSISSSNLVTISLSFVESPGTGPANDEEPGGLYSLRFRAANNAVLDEHTFNIGGDHTHGSAPASSYFNLRVAFPDGTTSVELRHDNSVLWSDSVSANPPSVSFTSPNGGSHSANSPLAIAWSAADGDGDTLQFSLEYSADGGSSWTLIAPKLSGSSFDWSPGFAPASANARLRIRASDGFNTATALSAPFTLTAKAPYAFISTPAPGQTFTEGQTIQLEGSSIGAGGINVGSFEWKLDSSVVGTQQIISTTLQQTGIHTITLKVTANGMSNTDVITINVLADYDNDGMPNAWEQTYKLNPLDPFDSDDDPDADGLSNIEEYQQGTNPIDADTDNDLANDGAEISAGTDPLKAASAPVATPVLQVGAETLGFDSNEAQPFPTPWKIWVTNGGGGVLSWTLSDDAEWLSASPGQGGAPVELNISANPVGLAAGVYTGTITITAPGAANSPQTITVSLEVAAPVTANPNRIFLPLLIKATEG